MAVAAGSAIQSSAGLSVADVAVGSGGYLYARDLTVTGTATLDGSTLYGYRSVTVAAGAVVAGTGLLGGSYNTRVTNAGTLRPGGAGTTGTLTVGSGYDYDASRFEQTATGRIELDVRSAADFDRLALPGVYGSSRLDGTLAVAYPTGYAPPAGTNFDVFTGTQVDGNFAAVQVPPPTG